MKDFSITIGKKKIKLNSQNLVTVAVVFLLVFCVVALVQSRSDIKSKRQELASIQAQCVNQQMENDALNDMLNNSDAEYIERKAREDLDYVLPGERVYIIRSGN